jgi:hypothetical protein
MPFIEGRTLRPDYFRTLIDPTQWPQVLAQTNVFKSYVMMPPADPLPGQTQPQLSDAQLQQLAEFLKARHIKVAFEVGGVRRGENEPLEGAGKRTAEGELRILRRWLKVGGDIDYLTTDHAVMLAAGAPYVDPKLAKLQGVSLDQAIAEQVEYFTIVHREIPTAKLGAIESLGFFHVRSPEGKEYVRTVPMLPVWRFEDYFDALLAAMDKRGLRLDHFDIDFGYEGVHFDGIAKGVLDYGRVRGVESYVQSKGVHAGLIVNAFHDQSVPVTTAAKANHEAYEHTLAFYRGYLAAGGQAAQIVIQTWQPYPDTTGPESAPDTVLNIARDVLQVRR